ncbi:MULTISPECIES: tyrosine-type recombinase/integrase [Pseudomonas]|uniref:Tyrosine-type recombinase/integrase n=1 Tax=Pseudomonas quercus TaxID=2722792 RepID=A0ABX0YI84_9PSED|nr:MULTISPECIES: site-specific integrase [Pseudomonas]MBF7143872.1 tyrosine-type recombinase/integrase [Pseudomonas sp. LY10J]NJP02049.1 tyrosine-type recombinase/integrase [Pseudomonas quercus]
MTHATRLLSTLRAFHLDQPNATWQELQGRLKEIAEDILNTRSIWSQIDMGIGQVYSDIREDLAEIAATEPLSYAGARAVMMGTRIMGAGEERLQGNLKPLLGIIEELDQIGSRHSSKLSLPVPICKTAPNEILQATQATSVTFSTLYEAFKAERGGDLAPTTKKNHEACTRTIAAILGDLDLSTHTRANMLSLRDSLTETRVPGTVNKLMTHASMVISWGVTTGLLKHDYSKGLTIKKGAESKRTAFLKDHLDSLKAWALGLPEGDWKQAAMLLGIASGARIGEIHQLHGKDIYKQDGQWMMSINDEDGKTLKNKFSRRVVPLVGLPEAILEALSGVEGKVFKPSKSGFDQMLNQVIRDVLGTDTGTGLSFHSLRHSLASDLKGSGVSLGVAQAILGHSSGAIAFDLYGGNATASMGLMVEALRLVR